MNDISRDTGRGRPRARLVVGCVAAMLVGASALAIGNLRTPRADAAATVFLNQMSDVAATRNATTTRPGKYAYRRGVSTEPLIFPFERRMVTVTVRRETEVWVALDGSGRQIEHPGEVVPDGNIDVEVISSPSFRAAADLDLFAGDVLIPPSKRASYPGFGFGLPDLTDLPLETDALRAALVKLGEGHGQSEAQQLFDTIGNALSAPGLPPAWRSALLKVAATVPGVTLTDRTTGPDGRSLVTVSFTDGSSFTVDPSTGLVTAKSFPGPDGELVTEHIETASNVDSVTVRPDGTRVPRLPEAMSDNRP
jgi:hypothetical protein